jgi:hypothetical protein
MDADNRLPIQVADEPDWLRFAMRDTAACAVELRIVGFWRKRPGNLHCCNAVSTNVAVIVICGKAAVER